eukprot:scaffold2929_cov107-Cylindrotheca_fusiformis.AAC.5
MAGYAISMLKRSYKSTCGGNRGSGDVSIKYNFVTKRATLARLMDLLSVAEIDRKESSDHDQTLRRTIHSISQFTCPRLLRNGFTSQGTNTINEEPGSNRLLNGVQYATRSKRAPYMNVVGKVVMGAS